MGNCCFSRRGKRLDQLCIVGLDNLDCRGSVRVERCGREKSESVFVSYAKENAVSDRIAAS